MGRKRNKTAAMLARFDQADWPIYVIDREQQIVYCNGACCQWLEKPAEEIVGRSCVYAAVNEIDPAAESLPLAPPPGAWDSQQPVTVTMTLGDDPAVTYHVSFHPLRVNQAQEALLALAAPVAATGEQDDGELSPADLHDRLLSFRAQMARQFHLHQLIGDSPAMARVRQQVRLAAASAANVLIVGEAGTGRQRLAKTIHYAQAGQSSSIASIACPITDAEMLQTAVKAFLRRRDELGEDDPGTILLLNVDQLPASAQHELAGFLKLPGFHVRLIGTSEKPLPELAAAAEFEQPLAFELSTLVIGLPPLSERRADIPLLAQHFLEQANLDEPTTPHSGFASEAIELLIGYDWPGNLPQLSAAVSEACGKATGTVVSAADLPPFLARAAEASKRTDRQPEPIELDPLLENIELELVQQALGYTGGNKTKAAELLGISRARMIRRVQQLGLEPGIDFEEIPGD